MIKVNSLNIELSSYCNADCEFCIRKIKKPNKNIDLFGLKRIINIISSILPDRGISLGGNYGDPLLYPDITEFMDWFLSTYNKKIKIVTNGAMDVSKFIKYKENVRIIFSIESILENDIHRKINSKKAFNNMLYLKQNGVHVECKTIVFKYNEQQIINMEEICNNNGIPFYIMNSREYHIAGPLSRTQHIIPVDKFEESWQTYNYCRLKNYLDIQISSEGFIYPCCAVTKNWVFDKHINSIENIEQLEKYFSFYYKEIHPNCIVCRYK